MTAALLALTLAQTTALELSPSDAGAVRESGDAGANALPDLADPGASAVPATAVEIHGVRVPLIFDPRPPGNRPVEGAVGDDEEPRRLRRQLPAERELDYDELMGSRLGELDGCAAWSPGGAEVKGWVEIEWTLGADGRPAKLRLLQSTLQAPLFERCLLKTMAEWHFPKPGGGDQHRRQQFYFDLPAREAGGGEPLPDE